MVTLTYIHVPSYVVLANHNMIGFGRLLVDYLRLVSNEGISNLESADRVLFVVLLESLRPFQKLLTVHHLKVVSLP